MDRTVSQRSNRRRLAVFLVTFSAACAVSLLFVFTRAPEYLAAARAQINPGSVQIESVAAAGGSQGVNAPRSFLSELQILTSRPIIEATIASFPASLKQKAAVLGADPVATIQAGMVAKPADGTDVVELSARGPDPEWVAALVNGAIGTYRQQLETAFARSTGDSLLASAEEISKLEAKAIAKRRQVEDFRIRHNIVSLERDENEVLARVKGQTQALTNAQEKLAAAEGKYRSMSESIGAGKPIQRVRSNPSLDNLEQRASQIREELSELGRSFTPAYLAMDPRVRAQRARLAELEKQIVVQRQAVAETAQGDQQAGLIEARDEAAAAREAASRIEMQIAGNRAALQQFTARFNEFRVLRDELAPLESLYRDALQRKAREEAGERGRRPSVKVLEAAVSPQEAWHPLYARDAGIAVAGSLLLALLAVGLVELFNRQEPMPTLLVPQPMPYPPPGGGYGGNPALARRFMQELEISTSPAPAPLALPASLEVRELSQDEIAALLREADARTRLFVHLVLRGLTAQEALAVDCNAIDRAASVLTIDGACLRQIPIDDGLAHSLQAMGSNAEGPMFVRPDGTTPSAADFTTDLLLAAHDAGLGRPSEVSIEVLRHTYAAYLARQGIRMSDLAKLLGRLSTSEATLYSGLAPSGVRLSLSQVERVIPAARATRSP